MNASPQGQTINWLFGRGLSMVCGLPWTVPELYESFDRSEKISRIKSALKSEMEKPSVDTSPIMSFLKQLSSNNSENITHRFITTNWDNLLQREISLLKLEELPGWLSTSHVFHMNGTVEELDDNSNRSPFLLEEDTYDVRNFSPEADDLCNKILWEKLFIVVGMSFECETDRFLLSSLGRASDDMPIGESKWLVLNFDWDDMSTACVKIKQRLPEACVMGRRVDFEKWIDNGLYDLKYMLCQNTF